MSEDILNISVVNFYSIWGDPEQNLKRMVGYVKSAARTGAQIVVFPEMALTGYTDSYWSPFSINYSGLFPFIGPI
jgi:predicted amidohydrolase